MIREINDYKQEMSFPRKRESINLKEQVAAARLSVGPTLCGRPKKTIGKLQLIIKISSTLRLSITHKYQEAGIPLIFS